MHRSPCFYPQVITGAKEAPQILEPLKSVAVCEGDSVIISTQILANPKAKVTWYRNGVELKPDGKNAVTKVTIAANGVLKIYVQYCKHCDILIDNDLIFCCPFLGNSFIKFRPT